MSRLTIVLFGSVLLLTSCRSTPPPWLDRSNWLSRVRRLKAEGRTGEALQILRGLRLFDPAQAPSLESGLARTAIEAEERRALRRELLTGPIELAPRLIELEQPPEPLPGPPAVIRPLNR